MQKFLSIPITATGETRQLLAIDNIIILEQASTTTVTVTYSGANGNDVATITHDAMAANDVTVRDRIQDSIVSALQTSWQHPSYDVSLSGLVSAASGAVTITGIVVA
tara:strand:+ start:210 stop:530 length:321 start_codon:yes stop_codon:yes gene_type:complete